MRIRFSHESVLVDPGRRSMWSPLSNGLRSFRLRIVSPTSCSLTFEFVSRTCWVSSLTAFAWSGWRNEVYTYVSHCFVLWLRERSIYIYVLYMYCIYVLYIHVQCSFRFLAERHKTLAKRLVGKTAGHLSNILPQLRPVQGGEGVWSRERAIGFMTCFGIVCFVGHSKHSDWLLKKLCRQLRI